MPAVFLQNFFSCFDLLRSYVFGSSSIMFLERTNGSWQRENEDLFIGPKNKIVFSRLESFRNCLYDAWLFKYWNEAVLKWAQSLTTMWGCCLYCVTGLGACAMVLLARSHASSYHLTSADLGLVLLYAGVLQRAMILRT